MMTGKLYETHVLVTDLERSIQFYSKLDMTLANYIEERRVAFFWFGDSKDQMLGIWEVPKEKWVRRHFAFSVNYDQIINARKWLANRGIETVPSFGREGTEPMVHDGMPAAAIYFLDPDEIH